MSLLKKQTVLIAMDGSKDSDWAFDWYTANMHRPGNQVLIVCCLQTSDKSEQLPVGDLDQADITSSLMEDANSVLAESFVKYQNKLRSSLMVGRVLTSSYTSPGKKIVKTAKNHEVSTILLGAHGQGTGSQYVGSVCRYVLAHASVPVIVCRHPDDTDHELSGSGSLESDENISLVASSSPPSSEEIANRLSLSDVCNYWTSVGSRTSDGQSRPSLSQLFLRGRSSADSESCVFDDDGDADDGTRDEREDMDQEEDGNERTKQQWVEGGENVVDDNTVSEKETLAVIERNEEVDCEMVAADGNINVTKKKAEEEVAMDGGGDISDAGEDKEVVTDEDVVDGHRNVTEIGAKKSIAIDKDGVISGEEGVKKRGSDRDDDFKKTGEDNKKLISGNDGDGDVKKTVEGNDIAIDGGGNIKKTEGVLEKDTVVDGNVGPKMKAFSNRDEGQDFNGERESLQEMVNDNRERITFHSSPKSNITSGLPCLQESPIDKVEEKQ